MDIDQLLKGAMDYGASDIHFSVGVPPMIRKNGIIIPIENYNKLSVEDAKQLVHQMLADDKKDTLMQLGDVDFSYIIPKVGRFRVNIYKQRGSYSIAIRILTSEIPTLESLGLPAVVRGLANKKKGLVLVTGPTGSGKSTTLAAMIDYINKTRRTHIITIEDPIEYLHKHGNSIINQREIGADVGSFDRAIRSALREDPDVILVGEMRDLETIKAAVTAAETGHLVLSTLHTNGAATTVDRIIDIFPSNQQRQIRVQLSNVLEGVITQKLVIKSDGKGRTLAMETLVVNDAVRNLIREEKVHQIPSVMQTNIKQGMQSMEYHLAQLARQGIISIQEAKNNASKEEELNRYLNIM